MSQNLSAISQLPSSNVLGDNDLFEISKIINNTSKYDSRKITYLNLKNQLSGSFNLENVVRSTDLVTFTDLIVFSSQNNTIIPKIDSNPIATTNDINSRINNLKNNYITWTFTLTNNTQKQINVLTTDNN